MALKMKMNMKLSQQFRLTPQLRQALKLLQVARHDLETEVRQELNENPVLEEVVDVAEEKPVDNSTTDTSPETEAQPALEALNETNWEAYIDSQFKPLQNNMSSGRDTEAPNYENMVSAEQTLYDHLMWQVNFGGFNDEEKSVLSTLINYVDDNGYVKTSLQDIAQDSGHPQNELEDMLSFLQELEPAGVGARSLQECLLIQARHIEEDTKDLVHLIENHLSDLERRNYKAIAKAMKLDVDVVKDMCQIILTMDPKPGRAFLSHDTQFITPDVYVHKMRDKYIISLNEDGLPRLRISNLYRQLLKSKADPSNKTEREYVKGKMKSAVWLIRALHQRQQSLYKVAQSIVQHQKSFLDHGPSQLKPLRLKSVASDVDLHESTVSRITSNKYMHTSQGLYELKYFFSGGVKRFGGEALSLTAFRLKLKTFIQKENPQKPFSDAALCDRLKKEGIVVARRTVAKHREALKIPSASKRKRAG